MKTDGSTDSNPVSATCIYAGSRAIDLKAGQLGRMKRPTDLKRKDGPMEIKAGNVAVKIYQSETRGRPLFTLVYRDTNNRRMKKSFANLKDAEV